MPQKPVGQAARDGTACHTVMDLVISDADKHPRQFLGATVDGVVLNEQHIKSIELALEAFDALIQDHEGNIHSELRVELAPDAFGTADVAIVGDDELVIADHKFGAGLVDVVDNDQLRFYAIAARKTLNLKPKTIEIAVIQPAAEPTMVTHTYTAEDLDIFEATVYAALKLGRSADAPFSEGPHCKWCSGVPACPLKTQHLNTLTKPGDMLDLAKLGQQYATFLKLEEWAKDAEERIHHELEHGVAVPGWKLVAKRAEAYAPRKLITPAAAEKLKVDVTDITEAISSSTTIALTTDKRPAVLPVAAIGAHLKRLVK